MNGNVGSLARRLAVGALGGLAWGGGMRAWMRFISFDPEFTWSGTLFIVGATTLAGTLTGLAYHRWTLGRGWFWRLLSLSYLPLGMAAGGLMLPSWLVGGIAWGRSNWPRWLRIGLAAVAVGLQVFVFTQLQTFPFGKTVPALFIYAVFLGIETKAFATFWRPASPNHRSGEPAPDTQSLLAVGDAD